MISRELPIFGGDTNISLIERLAEVGALLVEEILPNAADYIANSQPQPSTGLTYGKLYTNNSLLNQKLGSHHNIVARICSILGALFHLSALRIHIF